MQRQTTIRRSPTVKPTFAGLRKFPRKNLTTDVIIQDADGWEIPLESVDLSPAGMFVRSNFLFDVGQVHTLLIRSPHSGQLMRMRARVVRVEDGAAAGFSPAEFVPGMAYEFVDVPVATRESLDAMVAGA